MRLEHKDRLLDTNGEYDVTQVTTQQTVFGILMNEILLQMTLGYGYNKTVNGAPTYFFLFDKF